MSTTNNPMVTHTMHYGLYVGIAYSLISFIIETTKLPMGGLLSLIILYIGIYISTKKYRDNEKNGTITYGEAFGYSVLLSIFIGIIAAVYVYIQYAFITPTALTEALILIEDALMKSGLPTAERKTQIEMMETILKPITFAFFSIFGTAFIGLFLGLISSAVVQKEGNPFN